MPLPIRLLRKVSNQGKHIFVTNRHNCDPTIKLGSTTAYKCYEVKLELREQQFYIPSAKTQFFTITDLSCLKFHPSADVCIFEDPEFVDLDPCFRMSTLFSVDGGNFSYQPILTVEDIADKAYLEQNVAPMDAVSFIGFPGSGGKGWWDEKWNLPIARSATIASHPKIPFTHKAIKTTDTTLVSGFSFSGSSGSPVFLHQKGLKSSATMKFNAYVEPKIIGIMSGHFQDKDTPPMFQHTGLSYLTRSTSIIECLGLFRG